MRPTLLTIVLLMTACIDPPEPNPVDNNRTDGGSDMSADVNRDGSVRDDVSDSPDQGDAGDDAQIDMGAVDMAPDMPVVVTPLFLDTFHESHTIEDISGDLDGNLEPNVLPFFSFSTRGPVIEVDTWTVLIKNPTPTTLGHERSVNVPDVFLDAHSARGQIDPQVALVTNTLDSLSPMVPSMNSDLAMGSNRRFHLFTNRTDCTNGNGKMSVAFTRLRTELNVIPSWERATAAEMSCAEEASVYTVDAVNNAFRVIHLNETMGPQDTLLMVDLRSVNIDVQRTSVFYSYNVETNAAPNGAFVTCGFMDNTPPLECRRWTSGPTVQISLQLVEWREGVARTEHDFYTFVAGNDEVPIAADQNAIANGLWFNGNTSRPIGKCSLNNGLGVTAECAIEVRSSSDSVTIKRNETTGVVETYLQYLGNPTL